MSLNPDDIQKLGDLARLEIEPAEREQVAAKLSEIVGLVDQLQAAAADGVAPMAHPLETSQRLRRDEVTETDQHQLYQASAPLVDRDLYLVPRVIE